MQSSSDEQRARTQDSLTSEESKERQQREPGGTNEEMKRPFDDEDISMHTDSYHSKIDKQGGQKDPFVGVPDIMGLVINDQSIKAKSSFSGESQADYVGEHKEIQMQLPK